MKNRTLFLALLTIIACVSWAGKPQGQQVKAKTMEKNFVEVKKGLFAAKFEVSNIDYQEFLASIQDNPTLYKALNVQGDNWDDALSFSDPVKENYFSHPAFHAYPVVNVSHEGAQAYCQWLTDLYHTDERRTYQKVIFRLPTDEEWEQAASAGNDQASYAWGGPYMKNAKGEYLCNFRIIPQHKLSIDADKKIEVKAKGTGHAPARENYLITSPVDAFPANPIGVYNICGNAAEMTATPGLAKGGSWADTGYDVRIQSEQQYEKPSPKIGFRVFMEVIEE